MHAERADGWQTLLDRECRNLRPMREDDWRGVNIQGLWLLAGDGREGFVKVRRLGHGDRQHDEAEAGRGFLLPAALKAASEAMLLGS